jgi:uncharacterized membrane protein
MGALKSAVAAICGALVVLFFGSSRAQQAPTQTRNPTFELAVCNLSDFQGVFFALRHKQDAQKWAVDGWYAIPDGGCTFIGTFPRDTIYYYAESNDGAAWRGDNTDQTAQSECIDHDKWFRQTAGGSACSAGQVAVKFRLITIPPNLPRLTFSLTGSR